MTTVTVGAVTRELTQDELDAIEHDRAVRATKARLPAALIAGSLVVHCWPKAGPS